ncbi:MAG TPA: glycoside hydrolase family 2 protein [Anaerolineaceae bacterium]
MVFQSLAGAWKFRQAGTQEWLAAVVPGGVHTDLLAAGRIPDPFVADQEKDVQWVAETDWEYQTHFLSSPELLAEDHAFLVCDGLDTLATVVLNGHVLGQTDNMFRQYRWDVKPILRLPAAGENSASNELVIQFASPVKMISAKQEIRPLPGVAQAIPGGPYIRKTPCHFGWDWGPQLPPIGIWKDIRLEGCHAARFAEIHLRQDHTPGQAAVEAHISVERWIDAPLAAHMRITAPDGQVWEKDAPVSTGGDALARVEIPHPELWWPNGYGEQPLYQVEITLGPGGPEGAGPLDLRTYQVGLRQIELRQKEDTWGRSFEFVVNGVSVFAKGSNWIPADSFPTRITTEYLEKILCAAVDTHQNMLRVWGGGFYEDERFYDLCDRYGILVWQEFIFSCSIYPLDDAEFLENVHTEVTENIRRLRHRASLALWCGNNEMEWGWVSWGGWDRPELQDLKQAYQRFFHHTLPEWCLAEDPDRSYWPSSPSSDVAFEDPNGEIQGDTHYWDVWHGRKPFTAYRSQYPRFMSEFGFQALPPLATIRTYAQGADLNLTSYIMEHHQKNASGNGLMIAQMADQFQMPVDFPALVYLSLVLQAEGIRYGVEHWRRNRDRVAGALYWQLNDCWPVASWSSVDYFGRWKALNYAARRFFAPLMLSILDEPTRQGVYVTSDVRECWEGSLRWSLETLAGAVLASGQEPVAAAPLATTLIRSLDFSEQVSAGNRRELVFVAELYQGSQRAALQVASFVPTKHLILKDPAINVDVRAVDGRLIVELASASLARLLELSLDGADVVFTDNYFDLPAGRKVAVSCPMPAGWSLAQAQAALKLFSIYDSYAHS